MRTNMAAEVRRIISNYEDHGMGLCHALQKDNIQNSWGAKLTRKGNDFSVDIELVKEEGFSAVIFTDSGTQGLTGTKYSNLDDVDEKIDFGDPWERLANFEKHKGLGLYIDDLLTGGFIGQGKLMANIHSKDNHIYFDSRRNDDNEYLLGARSFNPPGLEVNNMNIILGDVKWNEDAEAELNSISNGLLKPLTESGTRIIIMNPTDELKEYIKSGAMLEDIENTWWEVIRKNFINGIYVTHSGDKKKAQLKKFFEDAFEPSADKIIEKNLLLPEFGRVKRIVFGFTDGNLPPNLNGLEIQRAGMPIVQAQQLYDHYIPLDLPSSHKKRFFGIVLLDDDLETQIRSIEKESHYGLQRPARGFQLYDGLRNLLIDRGLEPLKRLHNLIDRSGDPRERDREVTKNARRDINEIFAENGITRGPVRWHTSFIVSHKKSTGLKEMNFLGDTVKSTFQIKNKTLDDHTAVVNMNVFDEENNLIETLIENETIQLNRGNTSLLQEQVIALNAPNYQNGQIYSIVCQATIDDKQYKGNLKIYLNQIRETNRAKFALSPGVDEWPQNPIPRVDTDEMLKGITCTVASNILDPVKAYLDVRLYNAEDRQRLNGQHYRSEPFDLEANGTFDIDDIEDIVFDENITDGIGLGKIWLRFTLRNAEETDSNKPGDEIAHSQIIVYFNCDPPGAGIFEQYNPGRLGAAGPLAEVIINPETNGFMCTINNDHANYKGIFNTDDQRLKDNYTRDVLIRQGLLTCIKYNMLRIFELASLDNLSSNDISILIENHHGRLLHDALRNN